MSRAKKSKAKAAGGSKSPAAATRKKIVMPYRGPDPIVGIGASAGGLEAFERLLKHLPDDLGMGYVLVQHLDPTHESHLTEIFSRATAMRVTEVRDGMRVAPNQVYIIPPNTNMELQQGALRLGPRPSASGSNMPIDLFFQSLADTQRHGAVGVILSGTASDGAVGMKAIKAAGGITFAQDPQSAKYGGMPQSSISAGAVDFILRPEDIAKELEKIARHPYLRAMRAEETEAAPEGEEQDVAFREILSLLGKTFGVDFANYKQSTLFRRIRRRMAMRSLATFKDYLAHLEDHPEELALLYRDMFINVSGFFREADAFRRLQRSVFPNLFRNRPSDLPVRVWVPGCSTGEEAYSLAISLFEFIRQKGRNIRIQVFATDISEEAINLARKGKYLEDVKAQIDRHRLARWFVRTDDGYQIAKAVRDCIVFARHDVTKDPPFSRLDLVSCRNLLIYLGNSLQRKLIPLFHFALKPNGYLFLGTAETVGPFSDLFSLVDKKHKIYLKKAAYIRQTFESTAERFPVAAEARTPRIREHNKSSLDSLKEAADATLLNEFTPPSVLINDQMEILQFRGRTGPFLEPAPGAPSLHLFKMVREGLLPDLQTAIHECRRKNAPVRREHVRMQKNGTSLLVNLHVNPVRTPLAEDVCFLIAFQEVLAPAQRRPVKGPASGKLSLAQEAHQDRINQLKQELSASKSYLQTVIEKHEAANEELRSLNEEVMSSNEELQSTSEELETANEELQSANEELTTLNEELHTRNQDMNRANNDILNILSSMNMSLIMLDMKLHIRRFTPSAQMTFNLIGADVGRPLSDMRMKLNVPHLESKIRGLIERGEAIDERVQDKQGRWFAMQVQPYLTAEKLIDGAVIVLSNISEVVKQNIELTRAVEDRESAKSELHEVQRRLLETAVSRERDAMAREIHDSLSQVLAGIIVQLGAAEDLLSPGQAGLQAHLSRAREAARAGLEHTRKTAWAWRKGEIIEVGGLPKALDQLCLRLFNNSHMTCHTSFQEDRKHLLPSAKASNVFMVAQEALANAMVHANATEVWIELKEEGLTTVLTVRDNGQGFDLRASRIGSGFGLMSMEERVELMKGELHIKSAPGEGTLVVARIPSVAS